MSGLGIVILPDCWEITGHGYILLAAQKHPVWWENVFNWQNVATLKLLCLVSTSACKNLLSSRFLSWELNEDKKVTSFMDY